MTDSQRVLVYGASGHTGKFVVDELRRRGLQPIVAGRSLSRLAQFTDPERRAASINDGPGLRALLNDVAVVINCAGPFLDTALPLAKAAVETGTHYLDVTAEQPAVQQLYRELDAAARSAKTVVMPAMAFYGGLADLLLTAVLGPEKSADEVEIAIGLDRWWPTEGTRVTGARNTATRLVIRDGALVPISDPAATGEWDFPEPIGAQSTVELPFSEVVTINRHLAVGTLRSWLNTAPLDDLHDPETQAPHGRSAQRFAVEVTVGSGTQIRRGTATGRDIYASTAPILVEATARLLDGRYRGSGALAPGEAFAAADFLQSIPDADFEAAWG
ncbi:MULTISPECIES: saccharopine dehydrogenase family protein [Amycolatopsis]|uniref:Saccharopine dehydrogenase NADP-binding domain-containing protein n=1 Tax=Amycolatopsis dendrobii TaxID=2760662 RepID=A0A7W3ZBW9_9PSEU|nr:MULTISPECIES: saccharopine dehydrogenase NADP-binding domain-containing protein [Amycolatopsis]MBB1155292.1 saccharopine dehydrogenase NADP-binding domain-containing protein [Amycolatopsis dendrobii]UKD54764.1 saccharopine dehydrogenase NADP-binding domain-containing protein [Amycolatopsis sp. FU40]